MFKRFIIGLSALAIIAAPAAAIAGGNAPPDQKQSYYIRHYGSYGNLRARPSPLYFRPVPAKSPIAANGATGDAEAPANATIAAPTLLVAAGTRTLPPG